MLELQHFHTGVSRNQSPVVLRRTQLELRFVVTATSPHALLQYLLDRAPVKKEDLLR